jgi:hypothetical protein
MGYNSFSIKETIEPKKVKLKLRSLKKIQKDPLRKEKQNISYKLTDKNTCNEIIQPIVKLKENIQYDLKNVTLSYFEDKYQFNLHFGDIIQLSEYKAADSYIVSKDRRLLYLPQYDGSFHLRIPFEITQHIQDSVSIFQNIHPYLTHIYLRHDDEFVKKHIGIVDKSWDGKIAWLNQKYFDETIEVCNNVKYNNNDNQHFHYLSKKKDQDLYFQIHHLEN